MKLTYTEINGYLIPDLVLPETDTPAHRQIRENCGGSSCRSTAPTCLTSCFWKERCTATWPMWMLKPGRWWKMPSRKWPDSRAWMKPSNGPIRWLGQGA